MARWSPRRMAHTPNCIVKLDATRMIVIGRAIGKISSSAGAGPHSPMNGACVEVRREEPAEEHHLAGDEEEHPDQRRRHPRLAVRLSSVGVPHLGAH